MLKTQAIKTALLLSQEDSISAQEEPIRVQFKAESFKTMEYRERVT